jgi:hypothetical protein
MIFIVNIQFNLKSAWQIVCVGEKKGRRSNVEMNEGGFRGGGDVTWSSGPNHRIGPDTKPV